MNDPNNPYGLNIPPGDVAYAFPWHVAMHDGHGGMLYATSAGMTLRDYFAGQALAGMLADPARTFATTDDAASAAYAFATAMMKARDK